MLSEQTLSKEDQHPIDLVLDAILEAGTLEPTLGLYDGDGTLFFIELEIFNEKYHSSIIRIVKKATKMEKKPHRWILVLPLFEKDLAGPYSCCNNWRVWAVTTGVSGQYATFRTFRDNDGLITQLQEDHRSELGFHGTKFIIQ